jgi:hypothetical protein
MSQYPFTRQVVFGAGQQTRAFASSAAAPLDPPSARAEEAARALGAEPRRLGTSEGLVRCLDRPRMSRIATAVRGARAGRRGGAV